MTELEREVRQVLVDLADQGRPMPLGQRALTGLRRRRQRRTRTVAAAAALTAVIALPQALAPGDRSRPVPDVYGRNVLAAYANGTDARVLNPASGRYRTTGLYVETVSPDLRFAAGTRNAGEDRPAADPRLGVLDTRTGKLTWLGMPQPIRDPAWSPDGRSIVARVDDGAAPRAVLIDPNAESTSTIALYLPAGRLLADLCWSDAEHLLAVTTSDAKGTRDLVLLDKYGRIVRTTTLRGAWTVRCDGRSGRVAATRLAEDPTGGGPSPEAAIIDVHAGTLSPPARLRWTGAMAPVAWRTASSFLTVSQDRLLIVDVELGTVTEARARDTPRDEPGTRLFISADGLAEHAAEVANVAF